MYVQKRSNMPIDKQKLWNSLVHGKEIIDLQRVELGRLAQAVFKGEKVVGR